MLSRVEKEGEGMLCRGKQEKGAERPYGTTYLMIFYAR